MSFEVGQQVSDYEILGVLGAGGMGRVYRVRNKISDRIEAMKVLLPDLSSEPELASRFVSEIRTLASFFHPNIAQLHTAFQVDNQLVMIMEFVEGLTLAERAKAQNLPLRDVLSYMGQVLAALAYAHERSVIHRDVKPENIMVTPHGIVKLMDFGIAKSNTDRLKTQPGTTLGSLYYMSPEQIQGSAVDARSDLYSVGITLYELTAGRRPFAGGNTYAVLDQQLHAAPQPPIEVNPSLPQALNDVILTAIAKEPMHRFQSADAFRNALETVRASVEAPPAQMQAAGPRVQPPPPIGIQHLPPPAPDAPKKHRGLWMAAGALAAVLVLIGAAIGLPHIWRARASNSTLSQTPRQDEPKAQQAAPTSPPVTASSQPAVPVEKAITVADQPRPGVDQPQASVVHAQPVAHDTQTQPASLPSPPPTQVSEQPVQAAPAGPSEAETEEAHDRLIKLGSRAAAVGGTVNRLRQEIEAGTGAGLRKDIAAALNRMEAYMSEADRAVQSNNPAQAQKRMDQAEKEIDTLEAFTSGR